MWLCRCDCNFAQNIHRFKSHNDVHDYYNNIHQNYDQAERSLDVLFFVNVLDCTVLNDNSQNIANIDIINDYTDGDHIISLNDEKSEESDSDLQITLSHELQRKRQRIRQY